MRSKLRLEKCYPISLSNSKKYSHNFLQKFQKFRKKNLTLKSKEKQLPKPVWNGYNIIYIEGRLMGGDSIKTLFVKKEMKPKTN